MRLFDLWRLGDKVVSRDLGAPVFPLLGIVTKALSTQTPSLYIDRITVQSLIDRAGGWGASQSGFDAIFSLRSFSSALEPRRPSEQDGHSQMHGW